MLCCVVLCCAARPDVNFSQPALHVITVRRVGRAAFGSNPEQSSPGETLEGMGRCADRGDEGAVVGLSPATSSTDLICHLAEAQPQAEAEAERPRP